MAEHRHPIRGAGGALALAGVLAFTLGSCGQGDEGGGSIRRAQWQRIPWDLTRAQVVNRLGESPSGETAEKCFPTAEGRFCSKAVLYRFGDVTAEFSFIRPQKGGEGKLNLKTWTVGSKPNAISARQYRSAISRGTTMRRAEARLGNAEERRDSLSACEVRGHPGCGGHVSKPTRCLRYGWTGGGGDRVYVCFNLRTGRLLSDSYLTPDPSFTIQVPAE